MRMTTTKAYDYLNRFTSIGHADPSPTTLGSYSCGYNAANQRTDVVHADGSYWNYGYDVLGQVITAKKRSCSTGCNRRRAPEFGEMIRSRH